MKRIFSVCSFALLNFCSLVALSVHAEDRTEVCNEHRTTCMTLYEAMLDRGIVYFTVKFERDGRSEVVGNLMLKEECEDSKYVTVRQIPMDELEANPKFRGQSVYLADGTIGFTVAKLACSKVGVRQFNPRGHD